MKPRTVAWALAVAAMLVSCGLGGPDGRAESLEVELDGLDSSVSELANGVWNNASIELGRFVIVGQCDPEEKWRATLVRGYGPGDGETADGLRTELESSLEGRGIPIEESLPESPGMPIWFSLEATPGQVMAQFGAGSVPGVELLATTGCYSAGRITSADPYALEASDGLRVTLER